MILDLPDRIRQIASTDPDRVAMIALPHRGSKAPERITYGELSRRAEATAVGLRERGFTKDTLANFMVPPGPDALVVSLALWRIGAMMVGVEPHSHGLRKVTTCLARVGPVAFFGSPEAHLGRKVFGWGKHTIDKDKVFVTGGGKFPGVPTLRSLERPVTEEPTMPDVDPDHPALIGFTTGSTGTPKPTIMSYENLSMLSDGVADLWELDPDGGAIDMPTFPIFWIIALNKGGTVIVPPMDFARKGPGDADPAKLVATINEYRIDSMFGSPALMANIAEHAIATGKTLPTMRRVVSGGAEIQGPLYEAVRSILPNGEIYSNYGATEALPVAEIDGHTVVTETWARSEAGEGVCVGPPIRGTEMRVIAIDDGVIASIDDAVELPVGQIGEVIVRSPHISIGYYQAAQDDAENKIPDGDTRWHRLGDLGFLDEKGRLWVVGRRSHRVQSADGSTHYPLQCEPVFNAHPDVTRSALIGPATGPGGTVHAEVCIELRPEGRGHESRIADELRAMADKYDATRGLRTFHFMKTLPVDKRHNAKIDRPMLARKATAGTLR